MDWILVAVVASSLVTATFKDKEACMGRVATLHDQKIEAKCVEAPGAFIVNGISIFTVPNGAGTLKLCSGSSPF